MSSVPRIPDRDSLAAALSSLVQAPHLVGLCEFAVLEREAVATASTFPSEIVTCRLSDCSITSVFVKYAGGVQHDAHGHRGGVAYEAQVYEWLLKPMAVSAPLYLGSHVDRSTGDVWLVLENLPPKDEAPSAVPRVQIAAGWIGDFHRRARPLLKSRSLGFIHRYDLDYYRGWAKRTEAFAGQMGDAYPWLPRASAGFERCARLLLESELTVIHGECYTNNVLFRGGLVRTVDWESTAVAAGEIDLAALTELRAPELQAACEADYVAKRWPEGAPGEFRRTLDCARLYLQFRWLGDQMEWTLSEHYRWRFAVLHKLAERLELI